VHGATCPACVIRTGLLVELAGTDVSDVLADVLAVTSATRQRPGWTNPGWGLPLEARLPEWLPGSSITRQRLAAIVLLAVLLVAAGALREQAEVRPFPWSSVLLGIAPSDPSATSEPPPSNPATPPADSSSNMVAPFLRDDPGGVAVDWKPSSPGSMPRCRRGPSPRSSSARTPPAST
jgi:hypothetical protein